MKSKFVAIGIVLAVLLLLAQSIAYPQNGEPYTISSEETGGEINYSIKSAHDIEYTEAHLAGADTSVSKYWLFYDEKYASFLGYNDIFCSEFLLSEEMSKCASIEYSTADAETVVKMIDDSLASGIFDTGLIFLNGALPDCLYDGTTSSKIIQWIKAGGRIVWSGHEFGKYVSTNSGTTEVNNYGSICLDIFGYDKPFRENTGESNAVTPVNQDLTYLAHLQYNDVSFGIDSSLAGSDVLLLGYTDGEYSSVAVMKCGLGQIIVFGGYVSYQKTFNLAHVIALGITHQTEIISEISGTITDRELDGRFTDTAGTTHAIILSDLKVSKIWVYDKTMQKFI